MALLNCFMVLLLMAVAACSTSLDLLLREYETLTHVKREIEMDDRVSKIMERIIEPLESDSLVKRDRDCSDGTRATCESNKCYSEGTSLCYPACDSIVADEKYYCKCNSEHTALHCNVTKAAHDELCNTCVSQGGRCYSGASKPEGYLCYKNGMSMHVTANGLVPAKMSRRDLQLGLITKMLEEYVRIPERHRFGKQ